MENKDTFCIFAMLVRYENIKNFCPFCTAYAYSSVGQAFAVGAFFFL
jgi:uncharacterized membrane protein